MWKIFKYSLYDLLRSKWLYTYCGFFLLLTSALFLLSGNLSNVLISLLNIILILVPLIATMFSVMYFYNSTDFTELLLSQPIPRRSIFLGQYLGVAGSLTLSLLIGTGVPFLVFGLAGSDSAGNFLTLLFSGSCLSFIFSALAFLIALLNDHRIKGFGLAILVWLFFAVIYDGVFLLLLAWFSDYPLDSFAMTFSMLNPIDLSRILILLKLDISALMGYTGAVFRHFLGGLTGSMLAVLVLLAWIGLPVWGIRLVSRKKDF